jgi:hypothetical protein
MFASEHLNPFGTDFAHELMHAPQPIKNWTEYCFFFGWDPSQERGVSIHIGRDTADPTIFHASLAIFLPDGEMLAGMYRGRDGDARGPGAGPVKVTCVEPGRLWMAEFDGLAHRMHRSALMNDLFKDSPPEPARFCIRIAAASPLWEFDGAKLAEDMVLVTGDDHKRIDEEHKKTNHWEQVCTSSGEINIGGENFLIRGVGMRDHSFGPRDYSAITGNHWFNGVFPSGRSFMIMTFRVGANYVRGGFIYRNDGSPMEQIRTVLEHPPVADADSSDGFFLSDVCEDEHMHRFRLVFESEAGQEVIEGETVHGIATTYVAPAFEVLGTDFGRADGAAQMCECPARYTWNGERGAGMIERIVPMPKLRKSGVRSAPVSY